MKTDCRDRTHKHILQVFFIHIHTVQFPWRSFLPWCPPSAGKIFIHKPHAILNCGHIYRVENNPIDVSIQWWTSWRFWARVPSLSLGYINLQNMNYQKPRLNIFFYSKSQQIIWNKYLSLLQISITMNSRTRLMFVQHWLFNLPFSETLFSKTPMVWDWIVRRNKKEEIPVCESCERRILLFDLLPTVTMAKKEQIPKI